MSRFRTVPLTAALSVIAALGVVGCASSGGSSSPSSSADEDQQLPDAETGIGTMTIDVLNSFGSQFRVDYIEDVSPVSDTVNAIVEEVWSLVPDAYVDLGIPIAGVNPEARLLGNTDFRTRSEIADTRISKFLNCGRTMTGDIADQHDILLRVLTQVQDADGKSVVATVVDATARPRGRSGNTVQCSSTGRLENEIVTRVRSQLVGIE